MIIYMFHTFCVWWHFFETAKKQKSHNVEMFQPKKFASKMAGKKHQNDHNRNFYLVGGFNPSEKYKL